MPNMVRPEFDAPLASCILCGGRDLAEHLTDYRGVHITKCRTCSFQFMNPQYTDEHLAGYYSDYTDAEDFEYWRDALRYGHAFYLSLIENHVRPGRLLDVGCGNGHLLEAALARGWSAVGYDVDRRTTQMVSQRLGVEVHSGDFFRCDVGSEYDLVTLHHVLEHVKRPHAYLDRIRRLVRDNGLAFVAVPNIRSLSSRLKTGLEKAGLRRTHIGKHYDTVHHLLYFEPRTLTALLSQHGFKVLYRRNCHGARPQQSRTTRFLMRHVTEGLYDKSTFLVIARKV
jgi:2-polyprenyl-3-methyl-5-hydroxy-6-metoxy-1,4-benzoquinol methylase